LGVLPGIIGAIQAAETIKLLLGIGSPLVGRLLAFDALAMRFRELGLPRDPGCPICGGSPTITDLKEAMGACAPASFRPADGDVDAATLRQWLAEGRDLQLIDVREPFEFQDGALPGATLIPLGEIHERGSEIDPSRPTVVYCRVGVRSAHAIAQLREDGHSGSLLNLQGGILAFRRVVEALLK
jgi:adenylyltransferase/sulfurtransferase